MSDILSEEIKQVFNLPPNGHMLLITIGNDLRGDDAAGPVIAKSLFGINNSIRVYDAGERPENSIDEALVLMPKKVVFIDAADFGGYPGEIRKIHADNIPETTMSTHMFPVKLVAKIIESDTKADVDFIGIQSKNIALGSEMSEEVRHSCGAIAGHLFTL